MTIDRLFTHPKKLQKELSRLSGFEIADLLEERSIEDHVKAFQALSPKLAAETFDYLNHNTQTALLKRLSSTQIASMLHVMHPDDRTAFLKELPQATVNEYLKLLPEDERIITIKLLGYSVEVVGHYMTTDYIAVRMEWSIRKVFDHIRAYGHDSETLNVIYVTDPHGKLIDDIRMRDLLFVPFDSTVRDIADNKFTALNALDETEQAINTFKEFDRTALPVIDERGYLVGIVTIDDILRLAAQENTEDMYKVAALDVLDYPYMETPFLTLMKKRAGWLCVLFVGEMFTTTAMSHFEQEIAQAVFLTLFLPLIISSGGNAGSQSSTLIIRAIALGEVELSDWWKIMKREIMSGLFLGCVLGLMGFFRVGLWGVGHEEHWRLLAYAISLSLVGVVMWGSFIGSMLPIILKRLGFDPATASAPLVATCVDVTGITIYFTIALFALKGTIL